VGVKNVLTPGQIDRLKFSMRVRGVSNVDLARRAGVDPDTLASLLAGGRHQRITALKVSLALQQIEASPILLEVLSA